jgi:hypothetical protein
MQRNIAETKGLIIAEYMVEEIVNTDPWLETSFSPRFLK